MSFINSINSDDDSTARMTMTESNRYHEEWIAAYQQHRQHQQKESDDTMMTVSRNMATRAGRLVSSGCTLDGNSRSGDSLWEMTRQQLEENTAAAGSLAMMTDNDASTCQNNHDNRHHHDDYVSNQLIRRLRQQTDTDAFFEEYPECSSEETIVSSDSDEESDHENEDKDPKPSKVLRRCDNESKPSPLAVAAAAAAMKKKNQNPYQQQEQRPLSSSGRNHKRSSSTMASRETATHVPQQQQLVTNPYHQPPPPQHQTAPHSNRNQQPPFHNNRSLISQLPPSQVVPCPTSWDNPNLVGGDRSYNRPLPPQYHQQQQQQQQPYQQQHPPTNNPFQTAGEMGGIIHVDDPPEANYHNNNNNNNNNNDNHMEQQQTTYTGPDIPQSLRRKFQPPTKRNDASSSNKESSSRPSSRNGRKKANVAAVGTNHKSSTVEKKDDDEEELPEELQHLDKELVKKIQNEIMESGDVITFDDIAGLDDAKQTVQEVVCWPMKRPDLFTGLRRAPNGLLLYGPPGTGKTLIGKAIAHESGATFFSISSSSLTSKWIGEGEKLVRTLFAVAAYREPAVVFIDEIDSLLTQRKSSENEASRRIKTEFLVQLDGTGTTGQGRVLVIGATNRPQELDEAARRRFTKRLYIPLPDEKDRRTLLVVMLKSNNHLLSEDDLDRLAKDTDGFSGADLKSLCTDAAMGPIRQLGPKALEIDVKDIPPISFKHFRRSLKGTRPSVAASDLVQYEEWDRIYGSKRADEEDDDSDA